MAHVRRPRGPRRAERLERPPARGPRRRPHASSRCSRCRLPASRLEPCSTRGSPASPRSSSSRPEVRLRLRALRPAGAAARRRDGARRLAARARRASNCSTGRVRFGASAVAALVVAGSLLWVLGVYQKEISLACSRCSRRLRWPAAARLAELARAQRARARRLLVAVGARRRRPARTRRDRERADHAARRPRLRREGRPRPGARARASRGSTTGRTRRSRSTGELARRRGARPDRRRCVWSVARSTSIAVGALCSSGLALVLAGQSGVVATRYYIPVVRALRGRPSRSRSPASRRSSRS